MKINEKMSAREKLLLYEVIELLRSTIKNNFPDIKDADDWIFSELDFTQKEIEQIYKGRIGRYSLPQPHTASCVHLED